MDFDFLRLESERLRLQAAVLAPRTLLAYAHGWRHFQNWCGEVDAIPQPCTAQTLSIYIVSSIDHGLRLTTIAIHLSAIIHEHRKAGLASPVDDSIRVLMTGARRSLNQRPRSKAALTPADLARIIHTPDPRIIADRNRALFMLGFASGCRRAELAALNVDDLQFVPQGLKVTIRRSKTDQAGIGRDIGIWPGTMPDTCPVRAVQTWLGVLGKADGPLFPQVTSGGAIGERLSGEGVSRALKRSVVAIGLDPALYAGHSLRAGCVTAAVKGGASVLAIMQRTGHKSVQTIHRYVRPASVFDTNPLATIL